MIGSSTLRTVAIEFPFFIEFQEESYDSISKLSSPKGQTSFLNRSNFPPSFNLRFSIQLQKETLPHQTANHLDCDSVPQRSLEHTATHDMERHQPVAPTTAQGNHPGGRCQRAGPSRSPAGGICPDASGAHVRPADR